MDLFDDILLHAPEKPGAKKKAKAAAKPPENHGVPGEPGTPGGSESITASGDEIHATSPEGERRSMKIGEFLELVAPRRADTLDLVLPDGVKSIQPLPKGLAVVHQTPPRVHRFKWIAQDSPVPFGPETSYREVRLALPYVVVVSVFDLVPRSGGVRLANSSECFFSNQPFESEGLETPLAFPALLNCSRFPDEADDKPLSWICVAKLGQASRPTAKNKSSRDGMRQGLNALIRHLFESGFNLSSEHHELSSWYSETIKAGIDPRLASVEAWQEASAADPLFVLEVPWLPTKRTAREVIARIAKARGVDRRVLSSTRDLLRVLFSPRNRRKTS